MKKLLLVILCLFLTGCVATQGQDGLKKDDVTEEIIVEEKILTPEEIKEATISNMISQMTLEEKIGQLFVVAFRQNQNGNITQIDDDIKSVMEKYRIGGVVFFGENIKTKDQTKDFISQLKESSEIPLFLAIDEEGGRVSRLANCEGLEDYSIPSAQAMAENGKVYEYNYKIGETLFDLGFNLDFAPVADVNTKPNNPVIGARAFGSDASEVAVSVTKAVKGFKATKINSSIKHFPGHGDTQTDTHVGEATVTHDMDRLRKVELVPFQAGIDAGCEFVMVGHISLPSVVDEEVPASLSKTMISDVLRGELGFDGVVITDALNMGAISEFYDSEFVAKKFIDAGGDIMLMPSNLDESYEYLINCVNDGSISLQRINQSMERILSVKYDNYLQSGYGSQWIEKFLPQK